MTTKDKLANDIRTKLLEATTIWPRNKPFGEWSEEEKQWLFDDMESLNRMYTELTE